MALACLAGVRAYFTVFGVGLAGLMGWVELPSALEVTMSPWVMGTAGALAVVEFAADKIPGVDSGWDLLQTLARIPAGAFLAAATLSDDGQLSGSALALGGGAALGTHLLKSGFELGGIGRRRRRGAGGDDIGVHLPLGGAGAAAGRIAGRRAVRGLGGEVGLACVRQGCCRPLAFMHNPRPNRGHAMNPHDESRLAAHRPAFLRHLPRRVEKIGRRLHHFLQDGWDINGLALLNEDALSLGHACRQHGLDEAGQHFLHLHEVLHDTLQQQALPDQETGERLWNLVEEIGQAVPMGAEAGADISTPARVVQQSGRAETPPANYWRRWGEDAPDATATAVEEEPAPGITPTPKPAAKAAPAPRPPVTAMADTTPDVTGIRVYHLTEHGPLSLELDQRMEAAGYEVELLDTPEELSELLGALPARLALVDAGFSNQLDEIGATVRAARELSSQPIQLVALSEADDITLRLNAKRAGVDLLLVEPNAAEVLKRLGQLVSPGGGEPFRVLIVEDDRNQALFAEGILRHAVPRWLAEPPLRDIVSGVDTAHVGHGGEGALYVIMRRRRS